MALPENQYKRWEKLSAKKLFIDETYNKLVVERVEDLGEGSSRFDRKILDRFVNFIGIGAVGSGHSFKKLQNGNVETYVLVMSLAVGIILIVNFLLQ